MCILISLKTITIFIMKTIRDRENLIAVLKSSSKMLTGLHKLSPMKNR